MQFEVGKESTPNTPVASTRLMYFGMDSKLTRERDVRIRRYATGARENARAASLGVERCGGVLTAPLSASEIIELLLCTIKGAVTPTGAGTAKLWTFVPGTTLDPLTIRYHDGARPWRGSGYYGTKLTIAGSVTDETKVTCDLIGRSLVQSALTGGLTGRVPDVIEGWETKLYIDSFGGTAGSTVVSDTLINWSVEIDNQIKRSFWANNAAGAGALPLGELAVKASLVFEAAPAGTLTEYNNWDAATKRLVRLEFGQNEVISGADKKFVTIDLPGAWTMVSREGEAEGTRTYELTLEALYDTTNSYSLQIRAQNARTAAY